MGPSKILAVSHTMLMLSLVLMLSLILVLSLMLTLSFMLMPSLVDHKNELDIMRFRHNEVNLRLDFMIIKTPQIVHTICF